MRNLFMATVATLFVAGTTTAAELGGSVGVEITENTAGNYVAETTLGFGVTADTGAGLAFSGFNLESVDAGNLTVDEWQLGIATDAVTVSFGDQGDIFIGNNFEIVGGDTIANPASDHESLIVEFGSAAVLIGFTDITTDIGDIENVQGSYTLDVGAGAVTGVADYNVDSEDYTVGVRADYSVTADVAVGGIVTYASATEVVAYEASAGYSFATAFVNGDDTDAFQNVGAGVAYDFTGLNVYAEGTYNVNAETNSVGAGVSFSF